MAGTEDETNTPWRLWRTELAFVAELTKWETAARDLLVHHLETGCIHWRYWRLTIEPTLHATNVYLCPTTVIKKFIWRACRDGKYATIDDAASAVTYFGPPWVLHGHDWGSDKPVDWEKVTWTFLPHLPHVTVRLRLLRLQHADVLAMLRGVDLLVPVSARVATGAANPTSSPSQLAPPAPAPAAAKTATPAPITAKEAACLDPKSWLVHVPDRFPEKEGETRDEYFKRVAKRMRRELKERAWGSPEYIGKKLYEFKLLPLRQPRARNSDKSPIKL
jgi:hypothetical protein